MPYHVSSAQYRPKCLDAKGEQCLTCESDEEVVVHHVDGDRTNNDLENLIPVCEDCHWKIHSERRQELSEWTNRLLPPEERGHLKRRREILEERRKQRNKNVKSTYTLDVEYMNSFEVDSEGYARIGEKYAGNDVEVAIIGQSNHG